MRPAKPAPTVRRAKQLRREMSPPEVKLRQFLRASPEGFRFRRQHPAGPFVLDFFCARANLAIEVDGFAHDAGDRPLRDAMRDDWLRARKIETMRIPAAEVMADAGEVAGQVLAVVRRRMSAMGKAPPSALRAATSPSRADGEEAF